MVNEGYLEPKGGRFCHRLRLGPDKPGGLSNGQAGGLINYSWRMTPRMPVVIFAAFIATLL